MEINMKRLFVLRYGKGGELVKGDDGVPLYFGNKVEAKKVRDVVKGAVVSFGPDHDKFNKQHGGK
jgi:hypothetical protein